MPNKMHLFDILVRPVITEKATIVTEKLNQYTFEVDIRANKHQIKDAVELIFLVEVINVNTIVMPPKRGRRGRAIYIRKKKWKKAIVTVAPGQLIPLYD